MSPPVDIFTGAPPDGVVRRCEGARRLFGNATGSHHPAHFSTSALMQTFGYPSSNRGKKVKTWAVACLVLPCLVPPPSPRLPFRALPTEGNPEMERDLFPTVGPGTTSKSWDDAICCRHQKKTRCAAYIWTQGWFCYRTQHSSLWRMKHHNFVQGRLHSGCSLITQWKESVYSTYLCLNSCRYAMFILTAIHSGTWIGLRWWI